MSQPRRRRMLLELCAASVLLLLAGLAAGGEGWSARGVMQLLLGPDG